jgi:hypothetical protein
VDEHKEGRAVQPPQGIADLPRQIEIAFRELLDPLRPVHPGQVIDHIRLGQPFLQETCRGVQIVFDDVNVGPSLEGDNQVLPNKTSYPCH